MYCKVGWSFFNCEVLGNSSIRESTVHCVGTRARCYNGTLMHSLKLMTEMVRN